MILTTMKNIDPLEAFRLMDGGAVLVDVREPDEWGAGHAPGAIHHPLRGLAAARLPGGVTLLVVCRSGVRSRARRRTSPLPASRRPTWPAA